MLKRVSTLIAIFIILSGNLDASTTNINMSNSAKKLIEANGLTFEIVAGDTYLVRDEDMVLAFDKDARFLIHSNEEGQLFIESEHSRVTLTFGIKNIYVNFLFKAKGKIVKSIV